jgi:hypothetical protein
MYMGHYGKTNYISVDQVRDKPIRATIIGVEIGEKYDRPILDLGRFGKFSLNKTNVDILTRHYGDDDQGWIDCEIELYLGRTKYQGQERDKVLIRSISPEKPDAKRETSRPVDKSRRKFGGDDMDDEIPF